MGYIFMQFNHNKWLCYLTWILWFDPSSNGADVKFITKIISYDHAQQTIWFPKNPK